MNPDTSLPLDQAVLNQSRSYTDPAGRDMAVIEDGPARTLSNRHARSLLDIYLAALDQGIWPYRYVRNRDILTLEDQLKLARAKVTVVGAGGLGGTALLLLARLGVGSLTAVDGDVFDETNLNRQALAETASIGEPKVQAAARNIGAVNPAVAVTVFQKRIEASNAEHILTGAQVVVDALDNIPARMTIVGAARRLGIPLVHGALAGFEGQVMTIFPEDPGLERIYGEPPPVESDPGRPEAVLGVPAPTAAIVATLQAMEVVKILLDRGRLLRNRLLHIDLEGSRFESFSF